MMYFMVFVNGLLLGILLRPIKDKIITKSRRNDTMLSTANSVADMQIKRADIYHDFLQQYLEKSGLNSAEVSGILERLEAIMTSQQNRPK